MDLEQFYIDGKWVRPQGHETLPVHAAATGAQTGQVLAGTADDAAQAVAAARRAFDAWSATDPRTRAAFVRRIGEQLGQRADDLARTIATEVGMPLKLASRIQVGAPVAAWAAYASLAPEMQNDRS